MKSKNKEEKAIYQKAKHEAWEWGKAFVVAFIIAVAIKLFVLDTMVVPTGSMLPTIQINDRLFVDKVTWQYQWPKVGEIVVFWTPFVDKSSLGMLGPFDKFMDALSSSKFHGHVKYVKRLVGVGGDTLKLVPAPGHPYLYHLDVNGKIPDPLKNRLYSKQGIFADPNFYKKLAHPEKYLYDPNYKLFLYFNKDTDYTDYFDTSSLKWGKYVTLDASNNVVVHVPKGYFFAMGDNTTDSFDSRYWGFVVDENMVGAPFLRIWPLSRFGPVKLSYTM